VVAAGKPNSWKRVVRSLHLASSLQDFTQRHALERFDQVTPFLWRAGNGEPIEISERSSFHSFQQLVRRAALAASGFLV
jgi:hypothetical protein